MDELIIINSILPLVPWCPRCWTFDTPSTKKITPADIVKSKDRYLETVVNLFLKNAVERKTCFDNHNGSWSPKERIWISMKVLPFIAKTFIAKNT